MADEQRSSVSDSPIPLPQMKKAYKWPQRHATWGANRGVTLYTNGVERATPSKKSATPSLRLPPHHLAPYTGCPRVMKAPARAKERAHVQKVPEEARNGHKTGRVKQEA